MAFNLNGLGRGTTKDQLKEAMTPSRYFITKEEELDGVVLSLEQNAKFLSPVLLTENYGGQSNVAGGDAIHLPHQQSTEEQGNQ